ncbi:uncharacterized protein LOC143201430 isoform X9 [Rhynchophorus ferrugineus]|uniref:Uncharacterized protein n=1 Tax=Rhynchophorus ferrugineus TaxID=354439 RepID=A0A834I252_RHYFE|nr:hypothetical protein GWI33_015963 [Rhynchophorus ferrugineus]
MIMFWVFVGLTFAFLFYVCIQCRLKKNEKAYGQYQCLPDYVILAQPQDQNVFNISSRVQGQEQRHPDAFVSLEHITIMNELNKPPKYDDAPPSYEEAIKIAMAQDNSLKTFQTEVAASQGTSSSSSAAATSSAATPQIQPAIPNRTE